MTDFPLNKILCGDALTVLRGFPSECVDCVVTSPPYYGLRDYGVAGQLGLEETPEAYIERLADVFDEVRRVLRKDGTVWVNVGDSYAGGSGRWGGNKNVSDFQKASKGSLTQITHTKRWKHDTIKTKDLIGIPWALAFELRRRGWYLRQAIIWHKPNPMPESVKDRCTKSHEYIFLLSKRPKYYFDYEAIQELASYDGRQDTVFKGSDKYAGSGTGHQAQSFAANGHERWQKNENNEFVRNKRDVWTVPTRAETESHFAVFPQALIADCIKAGCKPGGVVLDMFMGSGTTAVVAKKLERNFVGIELNSEYVKIAERKLRRELGMWL